MNDSRPIMEQYNELLGILGRFTQHKMNMDEDIQVSCIIDKRPPSWKDFKHTLKHFKKKMHFLLSIMSVVYVLTTHIPDDGDDAIMDQIRKRAKWDNDDYVCRGLILNDKHQLKFNIHKDAKSLMEAIKKRFGGNKETKKVQKTLLKKQYENITGSFDKSPFDKDLKEKAARLFHECNIATEDQLRAKIKWLTEGDRNTSFFHSTLKAREHKKRVETVCVEDGARYVGDKVARKFVDHFQSITEFRKQELLEVMPFKYGNFPMKYLGVPLLVKRLGVNECRSLIDSVKSKIKCHVTADKKIQKKNDVKARRMLLVALLNEHLMTFNQYKDAKSLFDAITTRFGGNDATRKTQKTLLKQMYENFNAQSTENKTDLEKISIDDLYNNFKIVEQEVKRNVGLISSSGSQNMAFVYTPSTSNNDDANQPNRSQLVHEDLEQIHEDDLKEMDLKWQLALLSMRAKRVPRNQENRTRNQETTRRTLNVEDTSSKAMVAIDGASFDWSYMADNEAPTNIAFMDFLDSETVAPITAGQKLAKKNELKARGTLLMALPDKHQLNFNIHKDAKSLMKAIEKRFGGNKEIKKVQKTLLKQHVFAASTKPPASIPPNVDNLIDVAIYFFFVSQSNSSQLDNDGLKQIDADDLEEMG
nr:zinc finger, CCHC-type [Tanacetum cinerariifolium]